MEKLIIVTGSPNRGKTISTNKAIIKLLEQNAKFLDKLPDSESNFWDKEKNGQKYGVGGVAILEYNDKKIALISYGDYKSVLKQIFDEQEILCCDIVVCCSHATKGKQVFDYMYQYIVDNIDLSKTKVIPIYKNFLYNYDKQEETNEYTANLIVDLISF